MSNNPPYPQMGFGGIGGDIASAAPPYPTTSSGITPSPYPPQVGGHTQQNPFPPGYPPQGTAAAPYPPNAASATVAYPTGNPQPPSGGMMPPGAPADASAPPADWKGEILNFDPQIQPPSNPFYNPNFDDPPPYTGPTEFKTADITEEEVRVALEDFATKKCCGGKSSDIRLGEIVMENVFKYELLTTTELRKTQWQFEPYTNQVLSGPAPVPNAWDIQITQTHPFQDEKKNQEIPGTASVRPCQKCWGNGRQRCHHCGGMGFENCTWCKGAGFQVRFDQREPCTSCNSMGRKSCTWCHGQGSSECTQCRGRGSVYTYLQLRVSWKVHREEFITEESSSRGGQVVPKKKLTSCATVKAFEDTKDRLFPITHFPNTAIQEASRRILETHSKLQTNDVLIRQQKHTIEVIRIASVDYNCKGENGIFRVYGQENKVFFPDYPSSSCCSVV